MTCFLVSLESELSAFRKWGEFLRKKGSTPPGGMWRAVSLTWPNGNSNGSTTIVPSGRMECRSCCCRKCSAARCCLHVLKRKSGCSMTCQNNTPLLVVISTHSFLFQYSSLVSMHSTVNCWSCIFLGSQSTKNCNTLGILFPQVLLKIGGTAYLQGHKSVYNML